MAEWYTPPTAPPTVAETLDKVSEQAKALGNAMKLFEASIADTTIAMQRFARGGAVGGMVYTEQFASPEPVLTPQQVADKIAAIEKLKVNLGLPDGAI